uniref:Putative serpin n=1 Tax=Panstrongylus lignarius TaxID=156445 RepID=A0A224XRJ3_9HEMI
MAPLTLGALPVVGILLIFTMPVTTFDVKELEALTEGSNKFAIELYQALKKPNENLIVSPISVQIVLALAYTGAGGNTATEIAKVLHLPENLEDVRKGHKLLLEQLQDPVLNLATKIFIEKTLNVKPEFQEGASKYFQSDAGLMDFIGNSEKARQEINQWVEQKTNNKIKDLLAQGTVDSLTRMILTNAIHFKANWASQFNENLTKDDDFYITPDNKVKVKMMFKSAKFPFKHHPELKAKILELPYENKEFKMIIILPDEINGLTEVENKLSALNLAEILPSLYEVTVNVRLPRFKMEKTMQLKETLTQLGIKDLFDEGKANLTGIADSLYASSAVQKAFIEVNEEGTEAAAATALIFRLTSARYVPPPEDFYANHPFIYVLLKNKTVLFIGGVEKFN